MAGSVGGGNTSPLAHEAANAGESGRGKIAQAPESLKHNGNTGSTHYCRARHLILQHALGRCIFVRHAPLSVTLYCPSRSSTHARKDGRGVTHVYARTSSRVGWTDGGGERVHARPNAWAFARALDGRRGYCETSPSTSAGAIYCARHMYAHSAYT